MAHFSLFYALSISRHAATNSVAVDRKLAEEIQCFFQASVEGALAEMGWQANAVLCEDALDGIPQAAVSRLGGSVFFRMARLASPVEMKHIDSTYATDGGDEAWVKLILYVNRVENAHAYPRSVPDEEWVATLWVMGDTASLDILHCEPRIPTPEERDLPVAASDETPAETLATLAGHESRFVRMRVARNRNTSVATLMELAADADSGVREAVARNANTPPGVLATDPFGSVRDTATRGRS